MQSQYSLQGEGGVGCPETDVLLLIVSVAEGFGVTLLHALTISAGAGDLRAVQSFALLDRCVATAKLMA